MRTDAEMRRAIQCCQFSVGKLRTDPETAAALGGIGALQWALGIDSECSRAFGKIIERTGRAVDNLNILRGN